MSFLYILSFISIILQICFLTVSVAAGLYYLAEIVEEYTTAARKTILFMISFTIFVYIMFTFLDNLPWSMVLCGLGAQIFHVSIMQTFPFIQFMSLRFFGAVAFLIINHVLAFRYFTTIYFPFIEVLGYFTICLWMVPCALFVSLSANDNVLPTHHTHTNLANEDVVTNYFSRGKKQGLLSLFNYLKDIMLPGRSKKSF